MIPVSRQHWQSGKEQRRLPAPVFEYLFNNKPSSRHSITEEPTSGAFFYTMQSYECSSTEDKPRAQLLTLGGIRFLQKRQATKCWSSERRRCQNNLTNPKKRCKYEPAIRRKTPKSHPPWCPGRMWVSIVDCFWFYKRSTNENLQTLKQSRTKISLKD